METSELIFRVLNKEASPAEIKYLHQWIAADHAHAQQFEHLRLLWQHTQATPGDSNITLHFQPIHHKIKTRNRWRQIIRFIVIFALILTLAILVFSYTTNQPQPRHLQFESATLTQISTMLQQNYNTQLQLEPQLMTCRFTGMIYNDTPAEILTYITTNLGLTLHVTGQNSFTITGNCQSGSSPTSHTRTHASTNKI